jgi:glutamate-1-semialdehyde 2,1-aminomutase
MPVGAFAGRREIMRHLAPEGDVYQAGTLSGNPVAMAAGVTTLLGALFEARIARSLEQSGIPHALSRVGSVLGLWLQAPPAPRAFEKIDTSAAERYARLHPLLLAEGVWMAPSYFEVAFVSLAHTPADVELFGQRLDRALAKLQSTVP